MSHNKPVVVVDYGDNISPTHSYAIVGQRDGDDDFAETLKIGEIFRYNFARFNWGAITHIFDRVTHEEQFLK